MRACMSDWHPEWCREPLGGHGRDDDGTQVLIQFGGRDHNARARLLDLTAYRWIEIHKPDVAPSHQRNSASS